MPVIYIDNFRGFSSTFLPLKEVNFFVGENSTGKTSILKLIGIISSPGFWQYNEFGNEETYLGGFSEIITSSSNKKNYFEIGIFGGDKEDKKQISAIKLRFLEKDNQPSLKELCFINKDINVQVILDGKLIKYRYSIIHNLSQFENEPIIFFKEWISNSGLDDKIFNKEELKHLGIFSILFNVQTLIAFKENKQQLDTIALNIPSFLDNIAWIAPIRSEPKNIYDGNSSKFNSQGKHSPFQLKSLLVETNKNVRSSEDTKKILKRFGEDSGLYDNIEVNTLGNSENAPFEILISVGKRKLRITNVGFGVSQVLPLIVEELGRLPKTWFAIQQPEVHLHPRAQAAFGDFIFKSHQLDHQRFIIETHSDYTIDRFRLRINRAYKEKKQTEISEISQVVFFSRYESGNQLEIINIQVDGSYPDEQPQEFREFFIREQLDLISI